MAKTINTQPQDDVRVGILGPLEVLRGGSPCGLGGRQQRSVMALLALDCGRVVTVDRIADALWGERLPPSYLATLQTYIFHLREVLEPQRAKGAPGRILVSTPGGGYRLDLQPDAVDAARFEDGVARGRVAFEAGDASAAAEALGGALALWRGEVLCDLSELEPVLHVAQRLGEMRLSAIEDWAAAELALGHHTALVPQLGTLEAAHPLRERLAALRMVALYRSSRQTDALKVYQDARRRLADELGVSPGQELRSLHERILQQDEELARSPGGEPPALLSWAHRVDRGSQSAVRTATAASADLSAPATQTPLVTAPSRRPPSRTRTALALATVVIIASTLVSTWVTRARDRGAVRPVPANSAAAVGPGGLVGNAVALGGVPIGLAEDAGSVWVLDHTNATVTRVDQQTRHVVQTIPDVGNDPQAISARAGNVWVAVFGGRTVTRINAETNKVVDRIEVGNQPAAVVASDSGVWVANSGDNTVQRIDAKTGKADRAIPVGNGPAALAVTGSTLWVANARSGTVSALDTQTGERRSADIVVDAGPAALAVTDTDVWVANQLGRTVSRIDRGTGAVARIFVDDGPSAIVASGEDVWVANAYAGSLSRIDSRSNAVTSLLVGSSPRALTLVGDEIWTASGAIGGGEHVGGTLTVAGDLTFDAESVDPARAYYPPVNSMLRLVYDGLVAFGRPGGLSGQTIVPDLATALPQPSDGGRTYTFTIRRDVHYSDGREVKPSDFVLGFRRAIVRTPDSGFYDGVVGAHECAQQAAASSSPVCDLSRGVTADDDAMRLTVHLSGPDPELLYKLAYFVSPAPPGTSLDLVTPPSWIPSTGPYMVGSLGADGTLTLVRNPHFSPWSYAAQPPGYSDVIVHRTTESQLRGTEDVLAGTADLASVPYDHHDLAVSHPAQTHTYDEASTDFLYVNTHLPPFDNALVRQALNYAVDRHEFVKLYAGGRAVARASCQMLPPSFSSYEPYCPYQSGPADEAYRGPDLDKARRLVSQSGTQGASVTIHRKVQPPGDAPNIWWPFPDYVARVLTDLGYRVSVEDIPLEHRFFDAKDPTYEGYQLFTQFGLVADYDLASTFYNAVASCRRPNLTRYCNQDIDTVAKRAVDLEATDPGAALTLWSQVDRMLVDDGAFVTLGNRVDMDVVSTRVGNYQARASYGAVLSQLWVQ